LSSSFKIEGILVLEGDEEEEEEVALEGLG
jgi:hypothetical protein